MVNYLKIWFAAAGPLKNDSRTAPRGSRRMYGNPRLKMAASSYPSNRALLRPRGRGVYPGSEVSAVTFPSLSETVPVPAATARSVPITMQDALLVLHLHSGEDTCKHFPCKRSTQQEKVGTKSNTSIHMFAFERPHSNGNGVPRASGRHGCADDRKGRIQLRPDRGGGRGVPQEEIGRDGKDI